RPRQQRGLHRAARRPHRRAQPYRDEGPAAAHGVPAALWGRSKSERQVAAIPGGVRHALMDASLVIRGARVLDPLAPEARPAVRDIAISGDRISAVGSDIPAEKTLAASGMLAIPGFVSAHYHSHDTL